MYRLIFQNGPQRGRRVAIRQGPVILGRHPDATLRLPEPEVALQHALLEDQPDGGVRLRRLTAGAPIRVNRQEVEVAELRDGDVIEIGPHVLHFSSGATAEPAVKLVGRRVGVLQSLTLLAVGLLLAGQMAFLVVISLWPQKPVVSAMADAATTTVAVLSAPTTMPQVVTATNLLAHAPTQLPPRVVSLPTAVPVRVATVVPPPQHNAASNEMKKMQAEIAQLRHEVNTLPPPKPAVITNVVAAPVAPPPTPSPVTNMPAPELSADDLVLAQARKMFTKALDRVAQLDAEELDGELATIQNMAPDFLPPYIERAQRMQKRGLNAEALEQWQRVLKIATGADLRTRAAEEIASLQKRMAAPVASRGQKSESGRTKPAAGDTATSISNPPSSTIPPPPSTMGSAKRARAAQPVARIAQVESQKLLAGDNFDEMRLLRITVAPTGAAPLELAATEVRVTFFDRSEKSGRVMPSRAVVPGAALHAAAPVTSTTQLEFAASYLVPRGFRQREAQQMGEPRRYFGYRIELVCRGEVQERREQPANLLPAE